MPLERSLGQGLYHWTHYSWAHDGLEWVFRLFCGVCCWLSSCGTNSCMHSCRQAGRQQTITCIHIQTNRQAGRQTDRATDRQAHRQARRQTDRFTDIETDRHSNRCMYIQTYTHTVKMLKCRPHRRQDVRLAAFFKLKHLAPAPMLVQVNRHLHRPPEPPAPTRNPEPLNPKP